MFSRDLSTSCGCDENKINKAQNHRCYGMHGRVVCDACSLLGVHGNYAVNYVQDLRLAALWYHLWVTHVKSGRAVVQTVEFIINFLIGFLGATTAILNLAKDWKGGWKG